MKEQATYKKEPVPLSFSYEGKTYLGMAMPLQESCSEDVCFALSVVLNEDTLGVISCGRNLHWTMSGVEQGLVDKIGQEILLWYE